MLGQVEGRGYDVAVRYAEGDLSRLPALAIELAGLKPDILVAANTTAAVAARGVTTTIPREDTGLGRRQFGRHESELAFGGPIRCRTPERDRSFRGIESHRRLSHSTIRTC